MKRILALLGIILFIVPFVSAYGVTFYNPAWNPQDGKIFELVEPGTLYVFNVKNTDLSMTKVSFAIDREAKNGGVTIYSLRSINTDLPELDEDETYDVIEVKYSGFVPHDTTKFLYDFKVAKDWLENRSIPRAAVSLHAYNRNLDVWEVLPTEIIRDDDEFVYFSAADDEGVHYLFIGRMVEGYDASMEEEVKAVEEETAEEEGPAEQPSQEAVSEIETEVTPVDLTPTVRPAPLPVPPAEIGPEVRDVDPKDGESRLFGFFILLALIVVIIIIYIIFGKKKLGYSVDKELDTYVKENLKRGKSHDEVKQRLLDVGWHHERVDKTLSKHAKKTSGKPAPAKPAGPVKESVAPAKSMSLAEAKALAAKNREALKNAKPGKKAAKKPAKKASKAKKKR